ncbi:MAG: hypothetical protein V3U71_12585 [Cocleimonas sp.]
MLPVFISPNVAAAIYKCKKADGSIAYAAMPCPKGSSKKEISTLASKKQLDVNKAKVAINDIKTVSDGLSNILRNGFGEESLKSLKEDYLNRKKRSTAKRLTKKGALWQQYLRVSIDPNNTRGIKISYKANRNKQHASKLSSFEIDKADKDLDISLMDVNVRAIRIGLKNKASEIKTIGVNSVEWSWFVDDFKCEMKASIDDDYKFNSKLTFQCKYQGS